MSRRTVHQIPLLLKPLFGLYGWLSALLFYAQLAVFRRTCRIEFSGRENPENTPNYIFCIWHENLPLFFIAHHRFRRPHIWLTFPLWYMKPIHLLKKWIGIRELAYGASGHDGKAALQQILSRLREGWSTFLTPDGPRGPLKIMKDGALLMSKETDTPVIPVRFYVPHGWRIPSWDRKRYPLPFSRMVVEYGEPVWISAENIEVGRTVLSERMNDPAQPISGKIGHPDL